MKFVPVGLARTGMMLGDGSEFLSQWEESSRKEKDLTRYKRTRKTAVYKREMKAQERIVVCLT